MAAQSCVGKAHCAREFLSPNFVRECMPRGQRKRIYEKSDIEFWTGLRDPRLARCDRTFPYEPKSESSAHLLLLLAVRW